MSVIITRKVLILASLLIPLGLGQTTIGSRTAATGARVDFHLAASVSPIPTGNTLPATCTLGDLYYKSNATAGQNIYGCTATDTWTQEAGGGGAGVVTILSGTVDPNAGPTTCVAAGTGALTVFVRTDTTPRQAWWCDTANHWRQIVDSSGAGLLSITGVTGADPSTPAAGSATITVNNTSKVLTITDDAGNISASVRAKTCAGSDFVKGLGATTRGVLDCGTPSGSGTDPVDVTIINNTFVFSNMNFANGAGNFWGLNGGNCVGIFNSASSGIQPGQAWGALTGANTNTFCTYVAPWGGGIDNNKFKDFISGGTPLSYSLYVLFGRDLGGGAGDAYIGFSKAQGTFADFVGIKYNDGAGTYQCIIRSGGADVTVTAMGGVTPDTSLHWVRVSNGGTANSVTCQVGAVAATTSAGAIAVGDYSAIVGINSIAGSTPRFIVSEARLHIQGRAAN